MSGRKRIPKHERIGTKFKTKQGYQVEVIDYQGCMKVQVMFLDEHKFKTWTQWSVLKNGHLKNPFHPSVCGVGYLGTDENGQVPITLDETGEYRQTKEYQIWHDMIWRCYGNREQDVVYENVTVCDRWHCYYTFLQDIVKLDGYKIWKNSNGYELDKDTKQQGVIYKVYSPETCCFIPKKENTDILDMKKVARQVKMIDLQTGETRIFESISKTGKYLNVSAGQIKNTLESKSKTYKKRYYFEYVD